MSNIFSAFCILVDEKALLPTAVWQNGGFGAKMNIRISNKHLC